jgi:hypothetical protein
MQKIINVLALASFGVSAAVVAGGSWVYMNRYALINDVKNIAAGEIMDMVPSMMTGALKPPSVPGVPSSINAPKAPSGNQGPVAIPVIPFGG